MKIEYKIDKEKLQEMLEKAKKDSKEAKSDWLKGFYTGKLSLLEALMEVL